MVTIIYILIQTGYQIQYNILIKPEFQYFSYMSVSHSSSLSLWMHFPLGYLLLCVENLLQSRDKYLSCTGKTLTLNVLRSYSTDFVPRSKQILYLLIYTILSDLLFSIFYIYTFLWLLYIYVQSPLLGAKRHKNVIS